MILAHLNFLGFRRPEKINLRHASVTVVYKGVLHTLNSKLDKFCFNLFSSFGDRFFQKWHRLHRAYYAKYVKWSKNFGLSRWRPKISKTYCFSANSIASLLCQDSKSFTLKLKNQKVETLRNEKKIGFVSVLEEFSQNSCF